MERWKKACRFCNIAHVQGEWRDEVIRRLYAAWKREDEVHRALRLSLPCWQLHSSLHMDMMSHAMSEAESRNGAPIFFFLNGCYPLQRSFGSVLLFAWSYLLWLLRYAAEYGYFLDIIIRTWIGLMGVASTISHLRDSVLRLSCTVCFISRIRWIRKPLKSGTRTRFLLRIAWRCSFLQQPAFTNRFVLRRFLWSYLFGW